MTIKRVTDRFLSKVIDSFELRGLFYAVVNDVYVAVDNSTGESWTEEFKTLGDCIGWLSESELFDKGDWYLS